MVVNEFHRHVHATAPTFNAALPAARLRLFSQHKSVAAGKHAGRLPTIQVGKLGWSTKVRQPVSVDERRMTL